MTGTGAWVDRPAMHRRWWSWLFTAGFTLAFFAYFISLPFRSGGLEVDSSSGIGWIVFSIVGFAFVNWSIFGIHYEVNDRAVRARVGLNRATRELSVITEVEVVSGRSLWHPRNLTAMPLVSGLKTRMLRVDDDSGRALLLTPTNPEKMRDEILRRRDALRGGSDD